MEHKTTYEYKFYHPVNGTYLSVVLYDDRALKDWKPYLDKVEEWFLNQLLDKEYDKLLKSL